MKKIYGERKEKRHFALTPFALSRLQDIAASAGLSKSETLERLIRQTEPYDGLVLAANFPS